MTYQDEVVKVGEGKGNFAIEPGTYPARVSGVLDLGTAKTKWFKTDMKTKKPILDKDGNKIPVVRREFNINFEIYDGDRVAYSSKTVGFTLGPKGFYGKLLTALGKHPEKGEEVTASGTAKSIIGEACMVNVINNTGDNGVTYSNVDSVVAPMKGFPIPELKNKGKDLFFDAFAQDIFDALPQFLKERIEISKEYKAIVEPNSVQEVEAKVTESSEEVEDGSGVKF